MVSIAFVNHWSTSKTVKKVTIDSLKLCNKLNYEVINTLMNTHGDGFKKMCDVAKV